MRPKTNFLFSHLLSAKLKIFMLKIARHPDYYSSLYCNKAKRRYRHHNNLWWERCGNYGR